MHIQTTASLMVLHYLGRYFSLCGQFEYSPTFFLLRLIDHIQNKDAEQWQGVFYICILFVSNIVWTLSCHMSLHNSVIVGIQMRSSVVSVLYRKSLKISNKARAQFTIGEITNYMRYVNTGNSLNSPLLINVLIFHSLDL